MPKPSATYAPRQHYSINELDAFAIDDLIIDMERSLNQSANGPFYPEIGVTAESLRAYAEECRLNIERYAKGGAHRAALRGFAKVHKPSCKSRIRSIYKLSEPCDCGVK